jgi:hypothetical protein
MQLLTTYETQASKEGRTPLAVSIDHNARSRRQNDDRHRHQRTPLHGKRQLAAHQSPRIIHRQTQIQMTRHQAIEEQIENIMDEFDFGPVHNIFEQNGWSYHDSDGVPTLGQLRKTARQVLRDASRRPHDGVTIAGHGRFTAVMTEDPSAGWLRLDLMFTPNCWNNEPTDYTP